MIQVILKKKISLAKEMYSMDCIIQIYAFIFFKYFVFKLFLCSNWSGFLQIVNTRNLIF